MKVKIHTTLFSGVCLLDLPIFSDVRGSFRELYHREQFGDLGIDTVFVQDNISVSKKGTLRGLHFQKNKPQAKLIIPLSGIIYDVFIDLRTGSPHFGKAEGHILEKGNGLFLPRGFAHGFLALSDDTTFLYKCDDFYDPSDDKGIFWNDADLRINWQKLFDEYGIGEPILSEKDARLPLFSTLNFDENPG